MSHLSTIIYRVERRLNEVYKGDEKRASQDSLWIQSIRNIIEYRHAWKDYNIEEQRKSDELYNKYSKILKYLRCFHTTVQKRLW